MGKYYHFSLVDCQVAKLALIISWLVIIGNYSIRFIDGLSTFLLSLCFLFAWESKLTLQNKKRKNHWEIKPWIHPYLNIKFWLVREIFLQLSILCCGGPQSLNAKRVQGKYHTCFMIIGFCKSHAIQTWFSCVEENVIHLYAIFSDGFCGYPSFGPFSPLPHWKKKSWENQPKQGLLLTIYNN